MQNAKNIVNSVECSSIESGIDLFNSHASRIINLSQCKVLVISEELATLGINSYISTLADDAEMSPHANIIISKSSALDFLNFSQPVLEDLTSKYYDLTMVSNTYSSYTKSVSLINFFSNMHDSFLEPVASLGSIRSNNENTQLGILGLVVFKNGKLACELTPLETICHMIISNEFESCKIQVPNPFDENAYMDVEVRLNKRTKNSVSFINQTPYISCAINLSVKILSLGEIITDSSIDYKSNENLKLIENSINNYFSTQVYKYLDKVCKQFGSDIDGFGKYAVKYFSTQEKWSNYNWLENYNKSFFDVSVNTTIKSGYSLL